VNQTATVDVAPAQALAVTLVDGEDDANVLARLLKKHIEDIAAEDPGKARAAAAIHGKLGLYSTDPEALVTLAFQDDGIVIKNGFDADLDGAITGPLKLQTEALVGLANPYTAMLRRRLKVRVKWSRPLFTLQTYSFLKVPPSMRPPRAS